MSRQLPAPAPGPARPVEAGTSFNDAPVLEPGHVPGLGHHRRDPLLPGTAGLGPAAGLPGGDPDPARLDPDRRAVRRARLAAAGGRPSRSAGSASGALLGGEDDQEVSGSSAVPVRYLNRDSLSAADEYSVDGTYYLVLDLSYRLGEGRAGLLPVHAHRGDQRRRAGTGVPDRPGAGRRRHRLADRAADRGRVTRDTGGSGSAGSGGPAPWVLAAAGTGAVLVAGALALPWWRRRRSAG